MEEINNNDLFYCNLIGYFLTSLHQRASFFVLIKLNCRVVRYIVSDCDSVQVLYEAQHYTKTPEEAAAVTIMAGENKSLSSFHQTL